MRQVNNRASGVNDRQIGKQDARMIDEDGFIGEYAFCKLMNICPDLDVSARKGSCDCIFANKRVDVKTTRYRNGRLIRSQKENNDVDVLVLAVLDLPFVCFPGWAFREQLCQPANLIDLGHGPTYALEHNRLTSLYKRTEQ